MKKIFTVLLLNLLRSTKHSKVITGSAIALLLIVGSLLALRLGQSPLVSGAQQANIISGGGASASASSADPAASQPAKPATPKADKKSSSTSTSKAQSTSATDSAKPSNITELKVKDIALDQPTSACSNQQPAYAIQAAHLSMTASFYGSGTIRWYWESRVDGADSTDNPPISSQAYTQDITAGSASINLVSASGTEPLLTAPTSSTYSYRFRLHLLGPNEVTSDWVSVPVVLDNSCQATQ